MTLSEPKIKKTLALFDGQNLFHMAKTLFGYTYPNYDPVKLAKVICKQQGWQLEKVCFYTGVPKPSQDPDRAAFWRNKLRRLQQQKAQVFQGTLNYHYQTIRLKDGSTEQVKFGYEKGVDVQIAIDALTKTRTEGYDVVLLFSQDQDLKGLAKAIKDLAKEEKRWLKIASAYPHDPAQNRKNRGINDTDWLPFDKATYDACIDPRDYRPKNKRS